MEAMQPTPLMDDPKQLLLDMAQERHLDGLLRLIVTRLAAPPDVALARIWLTLPAEGCPSCPMRNECPDKTICQHLVASSGSSIAVEGETYDRIDGAFRRFPMGVRKVGRIAATAEAIEVPDLTVEPEWIARPDWTARESIVGFGGQPLIHQGEVLGVLAIFSRIPIGTACLDWLRMIANHCAAAIANTRAWEEIDSLRRRLELENEYLQDEVATSQSFGDLVGNSASMNALARQIELVAPTDATVLITGESGTGKELVAREIHRRSARADRPLIRVNCAAIPRELYESEFFGHVRGAFTGALKDRLGRFELAHGGTIFLDEVGEIPLELQGKLLRVLQEGEFERVGETRTQRVDVRVIAATNKDLRKEAEDGQFRSDLFYRLNVFPVETLPLRKHKEDIPALTEHFLQLLSPRIRRMPPPIALAAIQRLQQHDWPGNVRELQHVLEHALIVSPPGRLLLDHLGPNSAGPTSKPSPTPLTAPPSADPILTETAMRHFEQQNLRRALQHTQGKIHGPNGAAQLLGIKPTTLISRLQKHAINPRDYANK